MRSCETNGGDRTNASPELRIQDEDFPALPGTAHVDPLHGQWRNGNYGGDISRGDSNTQRVGADKQDIDTLPSGTISNIPPSMLDDQFGMAGLLMSLRANEFGDSHLVGLVFGTKLSNLGPDFESCERNIRSTFNGPWCTTECKVQEMDINVPKEYMTNALIRDRLPDIQLNKLCDDVLFYLFYNYPSEVYQLAAASELYRRDWRFHKSQRVWLTRLQCGFVKEQTSSHERSSYNVFDPNHWRKVQKEMVLVYKELESRPILPICLSASAIPQRRPLNSFNFSG